MAALIGNPLGYLLASVTFAFLYLSIVPAEEEFLSCRFGVEYRRYKQAVPRFLPRFKPFPGAARQPFLWRAILGESSMALLLLGIYMVLRLGKYFHRTG